MNAPALCAATALSGSRSRDVSVCRSFHTSGENAHGIPLRRQCTKELIKSSVYRSHAYALSLCGKERVYVLGGYVAVFVFFKTFKYKRTLLCVVSCQRRLPPQNENDFHIHKLYHT